MSEQDSKMVFVDRQALLGLAQGLQAVLDRAEDLKPLSRTELIVALAQTQGALHGMADCAIDEDGEGGSIGVTTVDGKNQEDRP